MNHTDTGPVDVRACLMFYLLVATHNVQILSCTVQLALVDWLVSWMFCGKTARQIEVPLGTGAGLRKCSLF